MHLLARFLMNLPMIFSDTGMWFIEGPSAPDFSRWPTFLEICVLILIFMALSLIAYCPPTAFLMLALYLLFSLSNDIHTWLERRKAKKEG